jgi:hypothetical protein
VLLFAAIACFSFSNSFARTWYITSDGSGDAPTIQAGIDSAAVADTVLLANGTFTGDGNRDIEFGGKAITVCSASGDPDSCIIDCEGTYEVRHRGISFRSGEDSTSVLEAVTITNGYAPVEPPATSYYGGCVYCVSSSPKIVDCKFTFSHASGGGAVGCLEDAAPILRGCTATDNIGASAGAVYCRNSSPTIDGCTFTNNLGGYTGAVGCRDGSAPAIIDCVFSGNWADGDGALTAFNSSPTVINCLFENNYAVADGAGAFYSSASSSVLIDCRFVGNSAGIYPGGAVWITDFWAIGDTVTSILTNCTFSGNTAKYGGGLYAGAYYGRAKAVLTDCTFIGNSGGYSGGGIQFSPDFVATLTNCSFVGNSAQYGGGIKCRQGTRIVLENSIVAYSTNGGGVDADTLSAINITCTDIYGNTGGDWVGRISDQTGVNGNISLNPLFCDPEQQNLMLASLSPCLPSNNTCGVQMGAHGQGCGMPVGIEDRGPQNPRGLSLQNYPNPFNPNTTITYTVPAARVQLAIFDVQGRLVIVLREGYHEKGEYRILWDGHGRDGTPVAGGVYFVKLEAGGQSQNRKILLLK